MQHEFAIRFMQSISNIHCDFLAVVSICSEFREKPYNCRPSVGLQIGTIISIIGESKEKSGRERGGETVMKTKKHHQLNLIIGCYEARRSVTFYLAKGSYLHYHDMSLHRRQIEHHSLLIAVGLHCSRQCATRPSLHQWWANIKSNPICKQKVQLSLGQPTVLVVSDLQGHPKSIIFISAEKTYFTFYQ